MRWGALKVNAVSHIEKKRQMKIQQSKKKPGCIKKTDSLPKTEHQEGLPTQVKMSKSGKRIIPTLTA